MKFGLLSGASIAIGAIVASSHAFAGPGNLNAAEIQARLKVFGFETVDARTGMVRKDKVVMSWLTHTTMATAVDGRVFLMDTYVARLETKPGRTPFVVQDIANLRPEAIFIGHGHGDHADNAAWIAAKSGAKLFASEETCGVLQGDLARMKADTFMQADPAFAISAATTISCSNVTTAGSAPATQVVKLTALEPAVCVVAFRHMHSMALDADPDWGAVELVDEPDPRDPKLFPVGDPLTPSEPRRAGQQDLRTSAKAGATASIWYQFVSRKGTNMTIAFNDTAGAVKEGKARGWDGVPADGQRILDVVRSLPYTDLQFGTASSGNTDHNGWRDHMYYLEALRPKIFVPSHMPVGTSMQYYSGFINHLALMEQPKGAWPGFPRTVWPSVRWLTDPVDTLKPMAFDVNDKAWQTSGKAARIAKFCGPTLQGGR
ncbi:MAG: hypothetical protein JWQ33_2458 [Ramlibacter sp.]|nr:hypothetical protein [Ramlibacter sp.]